MIKAIVFGIGQIVLYENRTKMYKELAIKFRYDINKFKEVKDKYIDLAIKGQIDPKEFVKKIADELQIKNVDNYYENWLKLCEENTAINLDSIELIEKLGKNYTMVSFSNVNQLHNQVREKLNIYKYFKVNIVSFKEGMKKPDDQFYELLIKRLKLKPHEILYIDDSETLVDPAKVTGMKTIQFKNNIQLKKELRELNIIGY